MFVKITKENGIIGGLMDVGRKVNYSEYSICDPLAYQKLHYYGGGFQLS